MMKSGDTTPQGYKVSVANYTFWTGTEGKTLWGRSRWN